MTRRMLAARWRGFLTVLPAMLALSLAASSVSGAAAVMRAAVAKDERLAIESVPTPQPRAGQVRIKVHAASVNPIDWKLASWAAKGTPQVPGRDVAGVIMQSEIRRESGNRVTPSSASR